MVQKAWTPISRYDEYIWATHPHHWHACVINLLLVRIITSRDIGQRQLHQAGWSSLVCDIVRKRRHKHTSK